MRENEPRTIYPTCNTDSLSTFLGEFQSFIEFLDNPEEIWTSAFEDQLSDDSQNLLICFATLRGDCNLTSLEEAFIQFVNAAGINASRRFRKAMKELDGNFLQSKRAWLYPTVFVSFHNPSVKDFTDRQLKSTDVANHAIANSAFHCQLLLPDLLATVELSKLARQVKRLIRKSDPFCAGDLPLRGTMKFVTIRVQYWLELCEKSKELKSYLFDHIVELAKTAFKAKDDSFLIGIGSADLLQLYYKIDRVAPVCDQEVLAGFHHLLNRSLVSVKDFNCLIEFRNGLRNNQFVEVSAGSSSDQFQKHVEKVLEELIDDQAPPDHLDSAIFQTKKLAKKYGCPESQIANLIDAEIYLENAEEQENQEREFEDEERDIEIQEEMETDEEIENILGALND